MFLFKTIPTPRGIFCKNFSSETALTWFAMDFTDDPSGQLEKLAVRFKLPETKEEFKKAFETAQIKLKTNPPPPNSEDVNAEDADDGNQN